MKDKRILIVVVAIVVIVVIAVAGLLTFLYFTNPEILTKTPREIIFGNIDEERNRKNGEVSGITEELPKIDITKLKPGLCLAFEEKYCGIGTNMPIEDPLPADKAIIGFNLPVGTPIFQLFDGYVASGSVWYREYPDQKMDNLTMHQNPEGISILNTNIRVRTSAIQFEMVAEVTDADGRPRKIKKGELIARVASTEAIEKHKEKGSFNVQIYIQSFGPEMEEEIQQWITALTKK